MQEAAPTKQGQRTNRRRFLSTTAAAAAATAYFPWCSRSFANESKNDRPLIGCIGVGSMGTADARAHGRFGDIVAVCDVDARHAERARNDGRIGQGKADAYGDYRRVLERNDVDVVSIVTPDHWHVKIAIEALQAGKHVFCQKPLTLTLEENLIVREACRQHREQVFFIGTQQRSDRGRFLRAINMVKKGLLGDVQNIVIGIDGGVVGGPFPAADPPKELDWDFWLGQAPEVEYRQPRCHYEFRWWYEYSGGKFTDWGAHHIDIATWAIGADQQGYGPTEIDGTDAKHPVPFKDGYPTVDHSYNTSHDYAIHCTYPSGVNMTVSSRADNGVLFEGTKGRIFVSRGKIAGKPIEENWDADQYTADDVAQLYKGKPHESHKQNFYRCIAEGGLPVSDVYSHVQTMHTCHLCAIAARLGRKINWDPATERITGDEQAATFFARTPRPGFEIPRV